MTWRRVVCQGVTNRFNLLGSKEDHYLNMVKTYSNCTVVLENLEVTYMEDYHDLSFLRSIQEVGGYVLIALNTANRIPLDNLRIIRGHTLYDSGFALAVMLNYNKSMGEGTTELPLTSLTEILKGGVKFSDNQLCNVETIQWLDIVNSNSKPNMQLPEPSSNRLYSCPRLLLYDRNLHQLVNNPDGKYNFGATCVKTCPHNYVVTDHGACVRTCSGDTYEVDEGGVRKCKKCDGLCPKVCNGLGMGKLTNILSINATNIDTFKNCTKINGNIAIIYTSIHGDTFTKTPKMDPAKLDVFKTVREITGYLLIQNWPEDMTSLSPFENLEIIRGRTKRVLVSLAVTQLTITHLGLRNLKEISDGDVVIAKNPNLCYTKNHHWKHLFKSDTQTARLENNADAAVCDVLVLV
ncbi:unnamed protein product [Coregonus sp. 'balchen']|nr:unnamed protein product [Coregonus sp. 'balchen']